MKSFPYLLQNPPDIALEPRRHVKKKEEKYISFFVEKFTIFLQFWAQILNENGDNNNMHGNRHLKTFDKYLKHLSTS